MLKRLKQTLYKNLQDAGFNVSDSWFYEGNEDDTYILLRLSTFHKVNYHDHSAGIATFIVDIFSKYNGEEEIIDAEPRISEAMAQACEESYVMGQSLSNMKIIDDRVRGPLAKHGIMSYRFVLAEGEEDESDEGND